MLDLKTGDLVIFEDYVPPFYGIFLEVDDSNDEFGFWVYDLEYENMQYLTSGCFRKLKENDGI